jgi:hypothetical protein
LPVATGALAALAVSTAFALGAVESDDEGDANGVEYRSGTFQFAGSGEGTTKCSGKDRITGAGATFDGTVTDARLTDLGPDYLASNVSRKRGVAGSGLVVGLGQRLKVYAICAKSNDLVYKRNATEFTTPGEPFSAKAKCPRGTSVTGGGFDSGASQEGFLVSAPYDSKDSGTKPEDGWTVRFISGPFTKATPVTAICSPDTDLIYVESTSASGTGTFARGAICPDKTAVIGGGAALTGDDGAFVYRSAPADVGDANAVPEDGWSTIASVDSGTRTLTAYAICEN